MTQTHLETKPVPNIVLMQFRS